MNLRQGAQPRTLDPAGAEQFTPKQHPAGPPPPTSAGRVLGPAPRPSRPPRPVVACWVLAVAAGGALIGITGAHHLSKSGQGSTVGLAPSTVASYLTAAAGPDAREVRINGVYGSGHDGAWQFVAHLTWRDPAGRLESATTQLPEQAGIHTPDPSLTGSRLTDEQRIGWTPAQLDAALAADPNLDRAPLASLELQTADTDAALTTCTASTASHAGTAAVPASASGVPAGCVTQRRDGTRNRFTDTLRDSPAGGPLSVQRDGHRITE